MARTWVEQLHVRQHSVKWGIFEAGPEQQWLQTMCSTSSAGTVAEQNVRAVYTDQIRYVEQSTRCRKAMAYMFLHADGSQNACCS